jgi:hypothetical protein
MVGIVKGFKITWFHYWYFTPVTTAFTEALSTFCDRGSKKGLEIIPSVCSSLLSSFETPTFHISVHVLIHKGLQQVTFLLRLGEITPTLNAIIIRTNVIYAAHCLKMDVVNHTIKWGTYREGALSQLPKFESLPQDGLELMQSYQAVLDNDETFTQYFSGEPLESYTIESRLRETLGIPLCSSDSENSPSISWVNIFRHGSFEKQSNGSYHCYDQGNLVQIDEFLHKSILLNRCFLPANSYLWPSPADAERESEITLAIEADVLEELDKNIKCAYFPDFLTSTDHKRHANKNRRGETQATSAVTEETP